jgi:hypothetical protein
LKSSHTKLFDSIMVDPGIMDHLPVSQCPSWATALGYMGVASAVCLSNWGSAVRVSFFLRVRLTRNEGSNKHLRKCLVFVFWVACDVMDDE